LKYKANNGNISAKRGDKNMRGNKENLVMITTAEEAKKKGRNGGIKSGEVRREKKTMREAAKAILAAELKGNQVASLKRFGITDEFNIQSAILAGQAKRAIKGDTRAAEFIRDTAGEQPDKSQEEIEGILKEVYIPAKYVGKAFVDLNRMIDERSHLHYWLEGGRGSTKSSFAALKTIELINNNPKACGIALRKVGNTIKDSVYAQLVWAIDILGLTEEYHCTSSPLKIIRKATGQQIYFRGADDPMKVKSIKTPKDMYIAFALYEEFDQFSGTKEIRTMNQSLMRGGEDFVFLYCYNTPRTRQHWVNNEKLIEKESRFVHRSNYRETPIQWLGQPFFDEAEHLKETSFDDYLHEYEGECVGSGGAIFDKLEIREITQEEIDTFGYCYQGQDWGWFPDPAAWGRSHYNPKTETIYLFDEIYGCKMPNESVAEEIKKRGAIEETILCDSAEPKSIKDFRDLGLNAREALKGPGSVDYGMKWLQKRRIVIDPVKCPNAAREFSNYEYEKNKDGEFLTGYPDFDNHMIDMLRYSYSRVMRQADSRA
jgi:phage terminase large subunit